MDRIEDLGGKIIQILTMDNRRIAAKLIKFNETHILIENSKKFRSLISRDDIVYVRKITEAV
jgi:hypothetical protein